MNKKLFGLFVLGLMIGGGAFSVMQVSAQSNFIPAAVEAEDEQDANEVYEKPDVPITGSALERASQVALDYLGQGRVTDTEVEDEESYYEVEVTLDNGREVDVQLDENFNVVGTETD